MTHPEYWTVAEVARYLGVTETGARSRLSRAGIQGAWRCSADEVRAMKESAPGRGARTDLAQRHST